MTLAVGVVLAAVAVTLAMLQAGHFTSAVSLTQVLKWEVLRHYGPEPTRSKITLDQS